MNRRIFIRNTAITAMMPLVLDALSGCNLAGDKQNRILVLIQLVGGNDGLNTLVPLDNYKNIIAARPNLYLPENKVLPIKGVSDIALQPVMAPIQQVYNDKLIGFVQGVGYENQNYSHFRSADIWLTGAGASKVLYTGWMARFLETRFRKYPVGFPNAQHPDPPAIKVGDMGTFLFQGTAMDMSIVIDPASTGFETSATETSSDTANTYAFEEVRSIQEILQQTQKYSGVLKKALHTSFNHSKLYPKQGENLLADQLKTVAKLIKGGLQTSVYHVDLKGFDTHDKQVNDGDTTKGLHAELLQKLSQAIQCFMEDMHTIGREHDVAGMTFSEFGRRIKSNASFGTDHGSSQPMMFFGAAVKPGITGKSPVIPEAVNASDNLAWQYDHRAIYSSVLKQWFGVPDGVVKDILPGDFPEVKIFA